jgi:hypothetical protein
MLGGRAVFTETVAPGQTTLVLLQVLTPADSGAYDLDIDVVHEHVRWFDCGVRTRISVEQADDPLEDSQFFKPPVRLEDRLSETLSAARVRATDADVARADVSAFESTGRYRAAAALARLGEAVSPALRTAKEKLNSTPGLRR